MTVPSFLKMRRPNREQYTAPEAARPTVVLNRWRTICEGRFDLEAHKAGVRYSFAELEAVSWSDRPEPRNPHKRKH